MFGSRLFRSRLTPDGLVTRLKHLPPAPKVLHKLQRLLVAPETEIDSVADLIKLEPSLSARIVRMANSAHFGRGCSVDNVHEAIQRVGLLGVHELVTFAVSSQIIGRPLEVYGLDAQSLWSRAVACALAAGSLADNCDVDRGDAYTAGLMHGIGLVVIDCHAREEKAARKLESSWYPLDYAPAEREWLGFSHAEAGAALLRLWGFSEAIYTAVAFQLAPEETPEPHRRLAMIVSTARWARSLFCVPEESIPELPAETWMAEAGIEIPDFGDWLANVRNGFIRAKDELRLG